MADEIDIANDWLEIKMGRLLKERKPEGPPARGYCYNCHEPLDDGRRWCDADCRDDWYKLGNPK